MEYDIEKILSMYEDDYNPSSMVPGPRNMYAGGQLVSPSVDGLRPGYNGNVRTGPTAQAIKDIINKQTVFENRADLKDKIKTKIGRDPGVMRPARYPDLKKAKYKNEMNLAEARKAEQERLEKVRKERATRREQGLTTRQIRAKKKAENEILREKKEIAKIKAAEAKLPKNIGELDRPLTKSEKLILNKSYDNIFLEEFNRLKNEGDLFSKTDLNRAVINRIADENPTIDLASGKGLDKVFNGDENHKSMHERTDGGKTSLITKKDMQNFTTNTNALGYTKNQDRLLQALLKGTTDFDDLMVELDFNEGRLNGNVNKLMRNLAQTEKSKQPLFFKKYSQEELENARNAVFNSPTLESTYQRTALQSILASTVEGSKQRKDALNKYKEFNKFKSVMKENGIDPKLVAMDHAASYRAIKNGNIKNFLAMTPIMSDINAVKSTFDRRSQLNLRRMQEAIASGDNVSYKKFLKNQTELEGIWKTMTGDQSSLGKIRIGATGKKKGVTKIFDYGATSILDKNKNLLNELGDNLVIRENIVKASNQGNLDEVSRIMFEGSEAEKPRPSRLPESFKNLNKPEMFKTENQIRTLLADLGCPKSLQKASGGRIKYSKGTSCPAKGREIIEKGLKNGFKNKNQQVLAEGILKSGRFLKDAVSLRGLFGPAALAFTAAAEAGIVGYDMLSTGKSFREAVGDSVFNYMLGDRTKIDSEEEFIKRLQNIKTGPSGLRDFSDEEIGKMQYFKESLKDMGTGFDLYDQLKKVNQKIEDNTLNQAIDPSFFSDTAFQLDSQKDKIQADIQDYNRTGTPKRVTDYLLSDKATAGADAAKKAALLVKQDQLQDAGTGKWYQAGRGDDRRRREAIDTKFQLEQMYNPNEHPFREYFMGLPKGEQSTIMSYGYSEGGITGLRSKYEYKK